MSTNQKFKITVPITRCYLRKGADGVEKYVVEGMASNTNLDLTGERMAASAIKSMARSLETHPVIFKNEHGDEWDAEFGEVTALFATDEHQLMMEAELDPDHYRTKTLVKALEKGKQLGLSIGGYVVEASYEWLSDVGRKVKTYTDIALEEISVTGSPAVADTWLTNITKSVKDWKDTPMNQDEAPVEKTDEQEEVVDETTVESPAEEAPADEPEESAPAKEESDAPDDEPAPVEAEASVQEEEESTPDGDEAADSAPDPADDDTSEVTKSAIFGAYAEADVAEVSVRALTSELSWQVWRAVYTDEEDERTPDERKAHVAAALAEFSAIVQKVADAFIDNGVDADAEKSFVTPSADDITKSLTEKDSKVAELEKSLSEKSQELETAQKELQESQTELEKVKARKGIVFDKFGGNEAKESTSEESAQKAAHEQWAGFITQGIRVP